LLAFGAYLDRPVGFPLTAQEKNGSQHLTTEYIVYRRGRLFVATLIDDNCDPVMGMLNDSLASYSAGLPPLAVAEVGLVALLAEANSHG